MEGDIPKPSLLKIDLFFLRYLLHLLQRQLRGDQGSHRAGAGGQGSTWDNMGAQANTLSESPGSVHTSCTSRSITVFRKGESI